MNTRIDHDWHTERMKRRILVIYTGGTIGMQSTDKGYLPMAGFHDLVAQQLKTGAVDKLPKFDVIECSQLIDSANLTPTDWTQIGQLLAIHWQDYDGFVVLHGTDTMAYTASALSFILQGIDKPVILTGSQIPLLELRNDAQDNLITALLLAANYDIPEVCIYFNGRLLRGNRSSKIQSAGFDAFDSPNFPWLARVGIHIDLQQSLLLERKVPSLLIPEFDAEAVAIVQTYPGMTARPVEAMVDDTSVRGLILQTYGSGNPPDANKALIQTLQRASDRGIAVLNITQCSQGKVSQGAYATGATLNRIGVVPGADMTLEAAFAKMHYLLSQSLGVDAIRDALQRPLCGELTR
ncbi:asparaginase [Photobacterium sp. OFAV2-7]|uniref:asparaginase n=1 Tax=Photobacterium sp. OFAV2-7 TaxID=2917748 RepID=UPI001EF40349|nr:asparaginase [Photobacterium sp. OFAV2-7]MCG7586294.1 asparaginase [Photobacterium sp. OFAV2-7]